MDPDALWEQARILIEEEGENAGAFVTNRIAKERDKENVEATAFWQSIAWRVAELRRRARSSDAARERSG